MDLWGSLPLSKTRPNQTVTLSTQHSLDIYDSFDEQVAKGIIFTLTQFT